MLTPDLDRIPGELKALPQWVAFRPDKTPVNPKTGGNAKADDPATWGEFTQAVKHWETHKQNGIDGVGFEFSFYDPYTGIDLDKCRDPETGQVRYCAQILLSYLNSYSEASPSGTGIHTITKARWPQNTGNSKKMPCGMKVEVYDRLRYFTVTGHHLEGTPTTLEDRQAELEALHREIFVQAQPIPKNAPAPSPTLSLADSEVLSLLQKATNSHKFSRLWRGDISEYGDDDSRADLAFCSMVAFYTQDSAQIDRLYRASALKRDKWDERRGTSTYGARTIDKALSQTREFYQGPRTERAERSASEGKPGDRADSGSPPTSTGLPIWPEGVMAGVAGMFARIYATYLETPAPFLFINYLTLLGHLVSDRITLTSEIAPQPRLYAVNLGESADDRKSTSINKTVNFFWDAINREDINLIWGVGSAEGLAKAFSKHHRGILVLDELKALVQKMRIDASVLLPCINTLFELNLYHSLTKKHDIKIDNAELCLLAASTLETYRNMFTSQFLDIGFLNRLFIVIGGSERRFAVPQVIPEQEKEALRRDLREVLKFVGSISQAGRYPLPLTSEARDIFESWYFSLEHSTFAKRLDTYGHRFMILLAVNETQTIITPEIAERTVALLNYQLAARKFADPIDADNAIARLEERIRRLLGPDPIHKRDLERRGSKNRVGIWAWNTAINNLLRSREVIFDWKSKTYSLVPE